MSRIRLLSHNTYWFQGMPFDSKDPGPPNPHILDRLVELYRSLDADVLCLQEVQSPDAFRQVARRLDLEGSYCPGQGLRQYGGAVFWRCGSLVADARNATHPPQRIWQLVNLWDGKGDALRVCHVHLPSAAQLPADVAQQRRVDELRALLDVQAPPAVVLGDFNEAPGGRVTELGGSHDYHDAAALAGRGGAGQGGFDFIWLHGSIRDRLAAYGRIEFDDMATTLPGKQYLSDHRPVWADLAWPADMG